MQRNKLFSQQKLIEVQLKNKVFIFGRFVYCSKGFTVNPHFPFQVQSDLLWPTKCA